MAWHWIFVIIFILAAITQTAKMIDSKRTGDKVFHLFCAAAYFILSGLHLIKIVLNFA